MQNSQLVPRFIVTEASRHEPALGTPSKYDEQRALFGPREPVYELEGALARYQAFGCTPKLEFDPKNCSWDDVFDSLQEAQVAYENKAKGLTGFATKVVRKLGDRADTIAPAFEMLPDQYGLSIVRGALGWMFLLTKDAATRRDSILATFKEVPGIIRTAEIKRKHFPNDLLLRDRAIELNDTVLEALTKMIRYLLPKNILLKVFPVTPDAPSGKQVDDMLQKVKAAAAALQSQAELLVEETVVQTQKMVNNYGRETQATRQTAMLTLQSARGIEQQVAPLPGAVGNLEVKMDAVLAELAEVRRWEQEMPNMWTSAANKGAVDAQNGMARFLQDIAQGFAAKLQQMENRMQAREDRLLGTVQYLELELERARTPPRLTAGPPLLTAPQLLGLLGVSPASLARDLTAVVREGAHIDAAAQGQAQTLLKMDRFWQWFGSEQSDLLMVSGHLVDSPAAGRVSALSAVCATIVSSVVKTTHAQQHAVPLYFFCGLHVATADELGGPQGMLRSLVSRLLLEAQAAGTAGAAASGLDFISEQASVDALCRYDVAELCQVFRHLVSRFPRNVTIYCLLDGVSWYERPETLEGLFHVVQTLAGLVDDPYLRPVLKVLLTSPFLSRSIAPDLPDHQRIFLRPLLLKEDSMTDRMLMAGFMSRGFSRVPERVPASIYRPAATAEDDEGTAEDYI